MVRDSEMIDDHGHMCRSVANNFARDKQNKSDLSPYVVSDILGPFPNHWKRDSASICNIFFSRES